MKIIQFETKDIIGSSIEDIKRRAKILIFNLSNNKSMLIHLKMTGQLIWEKSSKKKRVSGGHPNFEMVGNLPTKSTRAIFYFDDKSVLYFNDQRKFGYMKLYDTEKIKKREIKEIKDIGVDPFSKKFNVEYLIRQVKRFPKRNIKQFLTDQEIIAGIGNIYSNEGLFYARILPTRIISNILKSEWQKIKDGVIKALKLGLKYGGTSDNTFVNAEGDMGEAQNHLMVYRRDGEPCKKCKSIIKRVVLGGRGTFFCPKCQE